MRVYVRICIHIQGLSTCSLTTAISKNSRLTNVGSFQQLSILLSLAIFHLPSLYPAILNLFACSRLTASSYRYFVMLSLSLSTTINGCTIITPIYRCDYFLIPSYYLTIHPATWLSRALYIFTPPLFSLFLFALSSRHSPTTYFSFSFFFRYILCLTI